MIKRYCDKCEQEIPGDQPRDVETNLRLGPAKLVPIHLSYSSRDKFDICNGCLIAAITEIRQSFNRR